MKLLSGLLLLVVAASAYDFKDAIFNELLFEEFQSDYDDSIDELNRNRREAELAAGNSSKECGRRDWKKDFYCCVGDYLDREQVEVYKELKKQCLADLRGNVADDVFDPFDCEKMQQVKEQMVCVSECVARKLNAVDENGELRRDAMLEQLRKKIGDTQWKKEAVVGYVDKCLAEVKTKNAQSVGKVSKGCKHDALEFHHCIWREFSNGCPADLRVNTPKCNKLRERLAKNDTSFLNKRFLHYYHSNRKDDE